MANVAPSGSALNAHNVTGELEYAHPYLASTSTKRDLRRKRGSIARRRERRHARAGDGALLEKMKLGAVRGAEQWREGRTVGNRHTILQQCVNNR